MTEILVSGNSVTSEYVVDVDNEIILTNLLEISLDQNWHLYVPRWEGYLKCQFVREDGPNCDQLSYKPSFC